MLVFYYQLNGKTHLVCVRGGYYPASKAALWLGCNTSVWMVPGTYEDGDE